MAWEGQNRITSPRGLTGRIRGGRVFRGNGKSGMAEVTSDAATASTRSPGIEARHVSGPVRGTQHHAVRTHQLFEQRHVGGKTAGLDSPIGIHRQLADQ